MCAGRNSQAKGQRSGKLQPNYLAFPPSLNSLVLLEILDLVLSLFSLLVVLLRGNHERPTIFTTNH